MVRWFAGGEFQQRHLSAEERAHVTVPDEEPMFYTASQSDRLRFERAADRRRVFVTLMLVLLGIGVVRRSRRWPSAAG